MNQENWNHVRIAVVLAALLAGAVHEVAAMSHTALLPWLAASFGISEECGPVGQDALMIRPSQPAPVSTGNLLTGRTRFEPAASGSGFPHDVLPGSNLDQPWPPVTPGWRQRVSAIPTGPAMPAPPLPFTPVVARPGVRTVSRNPLNPTFPTEIAGMTPQPPMPVFERIPPTAAAWPGTAESSRLGVVR